MQDEYHALWFARRHRHHHLVPTNILLAREQTSEEAHTPKAVYADKKVKGLPPGLQVGNVACDTSIFNTGTALMDTGKSRKLPGSVRAEVRTTPQASALTSGWMCVLAERPAATAGATLPALPPTRTACSCQGVGGAGRRWRSNCPLSISLLPRMRPPQSLCEHRGAKHPCRCCVRFYGVTKLHSWLSTACMLSGPGATSRSNVNIKLRALNVTRVPPARTKQRCDCLCSAFTRHPVHAYNLVNFANSNKAREVPRLPHQLPEFCPTSLVRRPREALSRRR